jgi:very-short-patch-repair endonuclease
MDLSRIPDRPFTLVEAARLGLTPARLRCAVEAGSVRRILHGVYLRGDVELTVHVRLAAASRVVSRDAVACDRTAAWIWGVDAFSFRELDGVPALETFVLRGRHRTSRAETRGGVRDLMPCDWVEIDGVKVTTPLRTALDLGCCLNRREALAAMDALMRAHGFTRRELTKALPRYRRRRGVVQLRELVPLVDPRAESQRESWTRLEMHDFGLPTPQLQWWVEVDGVPTYRLDLAYPHARIAVEYDGAEHHTSVEDRARDDVRRAWLRAHGWIVIVIGAEAFAPGADVGWLMEIRDALLVARRPPRRRYPR